MPTAEVAPRVSVDSEEIMSALAHLMAAASVFCWLNGNTDSDLDGMLMDAYESLRIAAFGKTTGEDDLVEVETTARGHEIEATMLEKAADNLASIQKAIDYATRVQGGTVRSASCSWSRLKEVVNHDDGARVDL